MLAMLNDRRNWSATGLKILIGATAAAVVLALADGILRGPLASAYYGSHGSLEMFSSWCYNLRQIADELMFVGALMFVGGRFFEMRTVFAVGFDKLDAARISMKGPDDDNVVWVGHKYGSRLEAESVAATIESRLQDGAAG